VVIHNSTVTVDIKLITRRLKILLTENDASLLQHLVKLADRDLSMALNIELGEA